MKAKHLMKILSCISVGIVCTGCSSLSENTVSSITVKLEDKLYEGTYDGDTSNSVPDGEGVFTTVEEEPEQFTLMGTWKNGSLAGDIIVNYENGTKFSGKIGDDGLYGKSVYTFSDSKYAECVYYNDFPYGQVVYYSDQDEIIDVEWYYDGMLVADLVADSENKNYNELLAKPNNYVNDLVQTSITVTAIYENEEYSLVKGSDEEGKIYLVYYSDGEAKRRYQAYVPNFEVGDQLVVYGYFRGCNSYKTTTKIEDISFLIPKTDIDLGNTFPILEAFYVDFTTGSQYDEINPTFEYENIYKYPYFYARKDCEIEGVVLLENISYETQKQILKIQEENTKSIYYVIYNIKKLKSVPGKGDIITIQGEYRGNYKEEYATNALDAAKKTVYTKYPLVLADEISIK